MNYSYVRAARLTGNNDSQVYEVQTVNDTTGNNTRSGTHRAALEKIEAPFKVIINDKPAWEE